MSNDKLVRMANEIAAYFRAYPQDQACAGIRDHLAAFWTPGMRSSLLADAQSREPGLDPLVAAALLAFAPTGSGLAGDEGCTAR